MDKDIQAGRRCTLKIHPDSPASYEFGEAVEGCIKGREMVTVAQEETLNELYRNAIQLPVIVVEDENGIEWKVPEVDVDMIVCK